MKQSLIHIALVVRDYDEAIDFFCHKLNFELIEDTYQPEQGKRWVLVSPPGSNGTSLLLARAATPQQEKYIGNQSGDGSFYSWARMIFGVIIITCSLSALILSANQKPSPMAQLLYLRIFMETYGILWNSPLDQWNIWKNKR